MSYHIRAATLEDADALVHQRIAMFTDMGRTVDAPAIERAFRVWLAEMMGGGVYHAWVVEADARQIVAGGGLSILPWPPGPSHMVDRLAFVYNVYVEPDHRRLGLARRVMDAMHEFCRVNRIAAVALNASADGRPLYEALGYRLMPNPMMFFAVD